MAEIEFNLLEEPWIRVMRDDCTVVEVSLTDALIHAHEYRELAGELPTQNTAILRLLLAVLHTVFEQVDENGEECEIDEPNDAIKRWKALWEMKHFPEQPIADYLATQRENFWLFHPTRPFWQIAKIPEKAGIQSEPVKKINGAISESGHKKRLFAERSGEEKDSLSNAETARWLVNMNQYDDNTLKRGLGIALLGNFVAITAKGENLFETFMLNLVLLDRNGDEWDSDEKPSWETPVKYREDVMRIAMPHAPIAVLSSHSRYGQLERIDGKLSKYISQKGGERYDAITHNEQMALWCRDKKEGLQPLTSLGGKQVWREFGSIIVDKECQPVLVTWHTYLILKQCIDSKYVLRYEVVEINYDKHKRFSVENIYHDSLGFHAGLLSELGEAYKYVIFDEVERCEKIANYIGNFAWELFLAGGGDVKSKDYIQKNAQGKYYFEVDVPFRKWLSTLDAEDDADVRNRKIDEWRKISEQIANRIAKQMEQDAGPTAYVGKMVHMKENGKDITRYYSTSTAGLNYRRKMKRLSEE